MTEQAAAELIVGALGLLVAALALLFVVGSVRLHRMGQAAGIPRSRESHTTDMPKPETTMEPRHGKHDGHAALG